jgi:hypothetical protein
MAKHIIFLLHGMGDTKPGWSTPVQNLIQKKYQLYKVSAKFKFSSVFAFKELNYNHVFESHIQKWKENAESVTSLLQASGIQNDLLDTLTSISGKTAREEFASTHILDVILYRYMKGIKSQIISHISEQLVGKLNESSEVPLYSVVCHSLGTAVMHDVMQANLTTDHFPLGTAHGVPEVYMSLANVSRVLEDSDTNVYTSAVRPRLKANKKPYGCNQFINVAHTLDPFTKVKTFKPKWKKGAPNELDNLKYDSFINLKIEGLTGFNPHDMEHYLENPTTHVALFRNLLTQGAIKESELQTQMAVHRQVTVDGQFNLVETAIEDIKLDDTSSFNEAVLAWEQFQSKMKPLVAEL